MGRDDLAIPYTKRKVEFGFNKCLLFALQNHSNDKAHEILSFFHDVGHAMFESATEYTKKRGSRRCTIMYPGTSICVSINMSCWGKGVTFSVKMKAQNVDRMTMTREGIADLVSEAELLGAESQPIKPPALTSNRGFYIEGREVFIKKDEIGRKKRKPKIDYSVIKDPNLLKLLGQVKP